MRSLALLLILFALPVHAESWIGRAHVVDGDTIRMGDVRLKLIDIDAFESSQTCTRDGQSYPCGFEATLQLEDLIHGQSVRCEGSRRDQYRRPLVHCFLDGVDLGGAMVARGWAVAEYSRQYHREEESAHEAHLGAWAGEFERPIQYRHRHHEKDPR
jgi:endonuclease YncB( thermonuclease family)